MEGRQFNRRTLAILVVLTALLLLFFGVLYNLQVLHVDDYRAQSVVKIANRKTVEAARGELLDRYGRSMVTNRATYQLTLNTGVMGEEAVRNAQPAGAAQHLPGQRPDLDRHPGRLNGSPPSPTPATPLWPTRRRGAAWP